MRGWTTAAAAAALFAAVLWHLPATAQKAPAMATQAAKPAASASITFDEYRDFRLHSMVRRQAQLARQVAAPNLSAEQKTTLERKMAYYNGLAAMPQDARDKLFRARFEQIDSNHDGTLDNAERAAWRQKQHAYYAQPAAERAVAESEQR